MPRCTTLGSGPRAPGPDAVRVELDWSPGLVHRRRGPARRRADGPGRHGRRPALCLNLPDGAVGTTTIESKTNFLGAVRAGTARAVATPLHVGGTTIVVETTITGDDGRAVAKVTQTQMVLRAR